MPDLRAIIAASGLTPDEFARRMNPLTQEQVAAAMEKLPTDVLEWAVRFESAGRKEPVK